MTPQRSAGVLAGAPVGGEDAAGPAAGTAALHKPPLMTIVILIR